MAKNISKICSLSKEKICDDVDIITLPENALFMSGSAEELFANSYYMEEHPAIAEISQLAIDINKWILLGSVSIKTINTSKLANRSILIDNKGHIFKYYDKIHLYSANVAGGESHNESHRFKAGEKIAIASTKFGNIGMTICYDLRFPDLYRKIAKNKTHIITVPAAFTQYTGQAHWHTLLRARAIENACFIVAPAQTGNHPGNRMTYGHSIIIDPWGKILAEAGTDETIIKANIDTAISKEIRQQLPSLEHDVGYDF
jgi:predicted amidohydrolase